MLKNRVFQMWARRLHIYVSMALLLVVLFFTITGLTLNRPDLYVSAQPNVVETELAIPHNLLFQGQKPSVEKELLLNYLRVHAGLKGYASEFDIYTEVEHSELHHGEITLSFKAPGYNASVYIDMLEETATVEQSDYGFIALLNDAHKGRNCGPIWQVFIDITAILMTLFIVTGFCLIVPKRKTLWLSVKWMAFGSLSTLILYWIAIP
ncbi:PepSY-associated TM helix domain-containing protein [Vibrio europaeus]|uniref:PepSY-associated TM helix domain-containing protein n=1 Tax=Vibrio europaeus TaxID=300876 RepID=UPI002FF2738F